MNKILTKISAPGKTILFGEHSVVYGKLALAASLDIRTFAQISERFDQNLEVEFENLGFKCCVNLQLLQKCLTETLPLTKSLEEFSVENPEFLHHENMLKFCENFLKDSIQNFYGVRSDVQTALVAVFYLILGIFGSTNLKIDPISITIKSHLDVGSGTGSSASFLVSVAASLIQYTKLKTNSNISNTKYKPFIFESTDKKSFNKKELAIICQWSFLAEKIIHGNPSGIDNTICTYGSMVEFRRGVLPTLFSTFPLNILLIDSKIPKDTKKQVAKVGEFYRKYPDVLENIFRAMEDVSFLALKNLNELKNSQEIDEIFSELSNLVSMNHGLLSALGVSHSRLEEILLILNEYDLKGKLTGGGGGGYAISIIPPNFNGVLLETVMNVLVQRGFGVIKTTVGCEGVRIDF